VKAERVWLVGLEDARRDTVLL